MPLCAAKVFFGASYLLVTVSTFLAVGGTGASQVSGPSPACAAPVWKLRGTSQPRAAPALTVAGTCHRSAAPTVHCVAGGPASQPGLTSRLGSPALCSQALCKNDSMAEYQTPAYIVSRPAMRAVFGRVSVNRAASGQRAAAAGSCKLHALHAPSVSAPQCPTLHRLSCTCRAS